MKLVQPGGIMGFEGAGTVEKLGTGVQGLSPGDRVAFARIGSSKLFPREGDSNGVKRAGMLVVSSKGVLTYFLSLMGNWRQNNNIFILAIKVSF